MTKDAKKDTENNLDLNSNGSTTIESQASAQLRLCQWYYFGTCGSLLALIALCVAWELFLAPLRPGGSWMVLKVIPLLLPLRGILKRDIYTMQWSSMLILIYFAEGIVRATSDSNHLSAMLGGAEVALTCLFFVCSILYLRPYKKVAKAVAKAAIEKASRSRSM
ncbi:DUF2069 domain-containing protein [Glaciimonas sp. PAMC28666]|uniref:DUF2069 domain-containing protein n=1 Tax=Glaciimonas sp. PAMC28666 TaxID=2807626 RepID=UPI00196666C3|nr:DUF2069 domain-containing protein [Glaciimonas sp. PAMC28666]QRX83374.1 DUF2069 domain-containing protein [Glaciimonas sp. PAMC28666]